MLAIARFLHDSVEQTNLGLKQIDVSRNDLVEKFFAAQKRKFPNRPVIKNGGLLAGQATLCFDRPSVFVRLQLRASDKEARDEMLRRLKVEVDPPAEDRDTEPRYVCDNDVFDAIKDGAALQNASRTHARIENRSAQAQARSTPTLRRSGQRHGRPRRSRRSSPIRTATRTASSCSNSTSATSRPRRKWKRPAYRPTKTSTTSCTCFPCGCPTTSDRTTRCRKPQRTTQTRRLEEAADARSVLPHARVGRQKRRPRPKARRLQAGARAADGRNERTAALYDTDVTEGKAASALNPIFTQKTPFGDVDDANAVAQIRDEE